ncbi:DUF2752 domain-containing protein [Planctomycetaceae bacterium SH139]
MAESDLTTVRPADPQQRTDSDLPPQSQPVYKRLGWITRFGCFGLALTLATLWLIAFRLQPSEQGLGTHQQLGLPPCSARILWGIRCPACGMTTSWAHLANGQWVAACQANLAGVFLGLLAMVGGPMAAWSAISGRAVSNQTLWMLAGGMILALVLALAEWLVRIA